MTDSEIIKALEVCTTAGASCKNCPAYVKVDRSKCKEVFRGTLALINRQKAKINKLKEVSVRLRKVEMQLDDMCKMHHVIKAEAIKEFAERLKKQKYQSSDWSHGEHPYVVEESDIDDLVYEMVGENNAE